MIKKIPNIGCAYDLGDVFSAIRPAAGGYLSEFKDRLAAFSRKKYIYLTNSGIAAFYLILEAAKKDSGKKEVILPAYTAGSLVVAIKKAGLKPVLSDISLEDFNLDAEKALNMVSVDTLAVVCAHMHGIGMRSIETLRSKAPQGVLIIEDCCQAMGSEIYGKPVGNFSDAGFFSFNRGKNMGLYSGGYCVTSQDSLAGKIEYAASRIIKESGPYDSIGAFVRAFLLFCATRPIVYGPGYPVISRFKDTAPPRDFSTRGLSGFQSRLGLRVLKNIDSLLAARREKGMFLSGALAGLRGVVIPKINGDDRPVFNNLPILLKDAAARESAQKKLRASGIEATYGYGMPLHHLFDLGYDKDDFPNACFLAQRLLVAPTHDLIKERQLNEIVRIIKEVGR